MSNPMESTDEIPQMHTVKTAAEHSHSCAGHHADNTQDETATCKGGACAGGATSAEEEENVITAFDVEEALKDVIDPELGINIVDLGLVYGVTLDETGKATLDMTLTSPACPLTEMIESQTKYVLSTLVNEVEINWVWLPPWGSDKITDDGREQLRALGFNV